MSATACSSRLTATTVASFSSLSFTSTVKARGSIYSLPYDNFFRPNFGSSPALKSSRLKISHITRKASKTVFSPLISCLLDDNSETYPESVQPSVLNDSTPGATIDIKLPRRSLLAHFTCDVCGERSQKLINRLAYEKGTVFVQCSGCSQYHKLVDNLNLVVEYDFREDIGMDSDADPA